MSESKKTLVLGASADASRYSNVAARTLLRHGHPIVQVGPKPGEVNGHAIQQELPEDTDFDTVAVYMSAKRQGELEDYLLRIHPRRVIFPPGAENAELEKKLEAAGIEAVQGCTMVMLASREY